MVSPSPALVLFWHRRDLRISDNVGLAAARDRAPRAVGLFCFDPAILERDDVAPARVAYLTGSLAALQADYRDRGSELLIFRGDPARVLPALADRLGASLAWNWDVEPYARQRDRAVLEACQGLGVPTHQTWDQLLHAPDEVRTQGGDPYKVYTPFWRNWQSRPKADPVPAPKDLGGLRDGDREIVAAAGAIALPSARDLGFAWDGPLVLEPGTAAAQAQLETFCDRALEEYDEQRNFPANPGTSTLSAAFKFGTLGIRTAWAAARDRLEAARSDEARDNIRTWQQELAWREFYQQALYHFPELAEGPYRPEWRDFPWENDRAKFDAWCAGQTGYPIVDAAMRQLNETGWMHNRCRMIVASFLVKDLIVNWQWGERYFMQTLIDGDLAANNGGWQWSASSGMDPKPLRIFNPASQAQKYDPDGEYIRQWVPELRHLDTGSLLTGKIAPLEREGTGYPKAIADHKQQQQHFKQLYKAQKGG